MDQTLLQLSIVIPLYNEKASLLLLHEELKAALVDIPDHEILFVNDGSTDGGGDVLCGIAAKDASVRAINFRRNFGKSAALAAGFAEARGRYVATLDADLQDDPAEIPGLLEVLTRDGLDLVSGWKEQRCDPLGKRLLSRIFNTVLRLVSGVRLHDINCGLKVYRVEVVKSLDIHGQLHRYIPVLAHWAGFRLGEKVVAHRPRVHGSSKFGSSRIVHGFLDLITVMFLDKYMTSPLHFFGPLGFLIAAVGCGLNLYLLSEWLRTHSIGGRPLLFLAVMLLIVGIQFISFGLLAEMIARERRRGKGHRTESRWPEDTGAP